MLVRFPVFPGQQMGDFNSPSRHGPALHLLPLPIVVAQLRSRLKRDTESAEDEVQQLRFRALESEIEQLPYALGGAYWALRQLSQHQRWIAEDIESQPAVGIGVTILLPQETAHELSYAFDSFLGFARRAQNAVTLYLRRVLDAQLPKSLAELAKKRDILPGELDAVIQHYWSADGERLKNYRDLGMHHALVSSDARCTRTEEGVFLYFAIPNNPEANSAARLRFSDPVVYAMPYANEAFLALFRFIYEILFILMRHLGFTSRFSHLIYPREPLHAGSPLGHLPLPPDGIDENLWTARVELKAACTQRYGSIDAPPMTLSH